MCVALRLVAFCSFLFAFSDGIVRGAIPPQDGTQTPETVFLDYLFLKPANEQVSKKFDLGEVSIGVEVPVLIRVQNRSTIPFEFSLVEGSKNNARLNNGPVVIPDGENGVVELLLRIPDSAVAMNGYLVVSANLGLQRILHIGFSFRYRDFAVFTKSYYSHSIKIPDGAKADHELVANVPFEASLENVVKQCSVDADASLAGVKFAIKTNDKSHSVEARLEAKRIAELRLSGKIRLKVNDRVTSEATVVFKKETNIELLPNWVTLRFDPAAGEYRGELIAKLTTKEFSIDEVNVTAEFSDETHVEATLGKMSGSIGRIYVHVKELKNTGNENLLLF